MFPDFSGDNRNNHFFIFGKTVTNVGSMPVSKNPYLRYQIIHQCLASRVQKYWTIPEFQKVLREHDLEAGRRSLERDIAAMRTDKRLPYGSEIAYCHVNKGFYYTEDYRHTESLTLAEEELSGMIYAATMLHDPSEDKKIQFRSTVEKIIRHRYPDTVTAIPAVAHATLADDQLVFLLRFGDTAAYHAICRKYVSKLYAYARVRGIRSDDTRNILATIFAALWIDREALPVNTDLEFSLFRMLRYEIISLLCDRSGRKKYVTLFAFIREIFSGL
ncbi:MAG TPA: hypothetical protein VGK59_18400 [Ohtaekwangia sp.]